VKTAPPISDNQTYFEFQVEKQAQINGGLRVNYPSVLQSQGVEGKVIAQFVVDTTGRAEMGSWKVLESTNELFNSAAKEAVRSARFFPAEVGGRRVRQLVQQPITFALNK
jgi:protein TonB